MIFGGCWDCNWTQRLRCRFEISEKLWCLDEVVFEKKLVQILGSASGRDGSKFQNLGSASGVDGRFQKYCGALMKLLLRQSLYRFGAAHPVGMEDFKNDW